MESSFVVTAPGKVILFGEHAAVYDKPAIAVAIGLRSYLRVAALPESRTVHLKFPDIGLDHAWDIDALPWTRVPGRPDGGLSSTNTLDAALFEAVRPHAEAVSADLPEDKRKVHVRSATAFLYLFLLLASKHGPGSVYTLRSAVPIGAGLGSSASVCVCWSAALLLQNEAIAPPDPSQSLEKAKAHAELISSWAFVAELCIHGDPSGVDNAVSAGGGAVLYQRNGDGPPSISPISSLPTLPIWLVDTKTCRSTAAQVSKVRLGYDEKTELLLGRIERCTRRALKLFVSADFRGSGKTDALQRLGSLISENHELLVALGVSHPRLDGIVGLVDGAGIGWTKLTGAGGGGCAIVLLRPHIEDEARHELRSRLAAQGYGLHETVLGASGVGILARSGVEKGLDGDDMATTFAGDGVHGAAQQLASLEKEN
ncbi:MAG: Mevalonate kinase [Phylliscum demangeonii]|nr:MAG: Mevalonate kinase [Phylliscum demangeonii]